MTIASFWEALQQAASQPVAGGLGLWEWLKEKLDLAQYKPRAAEGVVARQLTGREGDYYILKNPATKTYYRLSDRDYFLWQRMDGTQSVKDLVVAYFVQYGSFAFARVAGLVEGLKANLFLSERPVNVYGQVRSRLERRSLSYRLSQVSDVFMEKQFAIGGLDGALGTIYRSIGRLFYTRPMLVLYVLVSGAGLYLFYRAFRFAEFGVVTLGGSVGWGIVGLLVANLASIFVHEMAHALTVKHYGREVRRGRFMLYFGMPAFFVDTMDIWMENKWARLAVTWAGPFSGLILGGLASIAISAWPKWELSPLLFQFAFVSYLTVFFNLNPLLELDGYFVLMDWLEIPLLRDKSLAFVKTGLREKIKELRSKGQTVWKALASLSREEKIFSVFGLTSAAWTVYAIFMGLDFWRAELGGLVGNLLRAGGDMGKVLMGLVALVIALPLALGIGMSLLGVARRLLDWAARRGFFDSPWKVAAPLLLLSAALALAPQYLGYTSLLPIIGLLALAMAAYLAWRNAVGSTGSRFAQAFWLLALGSLAFFLREATSLAATWLPLNREVILTYVPALNLLAFAFVLLASLLLFADTNLKELHLSEKVLLVLGFAASYGLVLFVAKGAGLRTLLGVSGSLFPLLALAMLVPTLSSFATTASAPAWLTLALALIIWVAESVLGWSSPLPYLLIASGLLLRHLAYARIGLPGIQPEAAAEMADQRRLQRAFAWTAAGLLAQFREADGERNTRLLVEQFNNYALAADWRLSLVHGEVSDSLPAECGLIERGQTYAAALTLLLDLVAREVGEKMTVHALQRVYDRLPWEEREIGGQYLFRDVERAAALSQQFQNTRQDYKGLLRRMPLFATMDEAELELLSSRLTAEHFPAGRVIIRQGDKGDRFYIMKQGHVEVTVRDEAGVTEVVNQLDRGNYFGELALLRVAPRNATCRATVPTEVLSLTRDDFDRLVKARFDMREKVDRSIARADLLRRMPLFAELDAQQVQLIAARMRQKTFEPGVALMKQGGIGRTFYVIESGRVQVSVSQDGEEKVVAERGPGEYVGEIALLLEVARTATVTALTRTRTLTLNKGDFDRLVAAHLYVSRGLEREASRRMIDIRRATAADQGV